MEPSEYFLKHIEIEEGVREELKRTRFHIWQEEGDELEDELGIYTLQAWLEGVFKMRNTKKVIEKYEKLVEKWLAPAREKTPLF